jgi:hypothetical protein
MGKKNETTRDKKGWEGQQKVFCKFYGKGGGLMKASLKNIQWIRPPTMMVKCWRAPRIGV